MKERDLKLKQNEMVMVRWIDAASEEGWLNKAKMEETKDLEILSVGFVAHISKNYLWLAMSWQQNEDYLPYGNCKRIVLSNIQEITKASLHL